MDGDVSKRCKTVHKWTNELPLFIAAPSLLLNGPPTPSLFGGPQTNQKQLLSYFRSPSTPSPSRS